MMPARPSNQIVGGYDEPGVDDDPVEAGDFADGASPGGDVDPTISAVGEAVGFPGTLTASPGGLDFAAAAFAAAAFAAASEAAFFFASAAAAASARFLSTAAASSG